MTRISTDRLERELDDHKPLYTAAEAKAEADRCLYCADAPCIQACPTEIDIPTFIKKIASGNVRGSARTIFEQNLLGWSCARVCPVEVLCAGSCVYNGWGREPIAIGRLQRFATEAATKGGASVLPKPKAKSGKKVACIGAGPASLAFAGYLALEGHEAVVFERKAVGGGLNTTGIAPYKLHADDALVELSFVEELGVEVRTGVEIGAGDAGASGSGRAGSAGGTDATAHTTAHTTGGGGHVSAKELLERYDAVFLGVGLGADTLLDVPGESGPGVFGATAWIERMKLELGRDARAELRAKRVVVIGGGNTAIDAARECAELGAREVTMVYRRGRAAMSGYAHEMDAARVDGVGLALNAKPLSFVRDGAGKLVALRVVRTDDDAKAIAGTEHDLPCDLALVAIGQSKLRTIASGFPGVALDERGCVVADPKTGRTGHAKVFAGGDCVNGGKEVVNAVADGRNAARALMAHWASGGASGAR